MPDMINVHTICHKTRIRCRLFFQFFKRSENDPCLYSSQENEEWMYISIHVDDLIVAATKDYMFKEFEKRMGHTLNIKNLGDLKYYLGIQFERDENGIFLLHQK